MKVFVRYQIAERVKKTDLIKIEAVYRVGRDETETKPTNLEFKPTSKAFAEEVLRAMISARRNGARDARKRMRSALGLSDIEEQLGMNA